MTSERPPCKGAAHLLTYLTLSITDGPNRRAAQTAIRRRPGALLLAAHPGRQITPAERDAIIAGERDPGRRRDMLAYLPERRAVRPSPLGTQRHGRQAYRAPDPAAGPLRPRVNGIRDHRG